MKSLQGQVLVASPTLVDSNFVKSVVLMLQHTDEGALGLILNRPTSTNVKRAWEAVSDKPCHIDAPLHLGGPCQGPLMVLHTESACSTAEPLPGVHFTGESEHVEELIADEDANVRFYVGYAGWGPGQLEGEVAEGAWKSADACPDHVFGDLSDLWQRLSREINASTLVSMLKIRHVPADPSVN